MGLYGVLIFNQYLLKKKNGSFSLKGIVSYREGIPVWQVVGLSLSLLTWGYFVLLIVFRPLHHESHRIDHDDGYHTQFWLNYSHQRPAARVKSIRIPCSPEIVRDIIRQSHTISIERLL